MKSINYFKWMSERVTTHLVSETPDRLGVIKGKILSPAQKYQSFDLVCFCGSDIPLTPL